MGACLVGREAAYAWHSVKTNVTEPSVNITVTQARETHKISSGTGNDWPFRNPLLDKLRCVPGWR